MRVIPVIDILNGKVVHAVKGKRNEYRPVQSILTPSSDPLTISEAFQKLGFRTLYIADLDSIIDCSTNFQALKEVASGTKLELIVDAGITNIDRAQKLLESGVSKLVIGTETLKDKAFVAEALERFGEEHVIVSLDLKGDKIITQKTFDGPTDAMAILAEFAEMGVLDVIVLDLLRVGSNEGLNTTFLKRLLDSFKLRIYAGGGVRNIDDLLNLEKLGISGALVATSLHNGKISILDLKSAGFLL
jgi:phosphoribosylformimino-5-aminoimidazole carboxamide ribotide isomerase